MNRSLRTALILVLASITLLAACRPSDRSSSSASGWDVAIEVVGAPVGIGPAVVEVRPRREGRPVQGAQVSVRAEMTHAGMGAPLQVEASETEAGVYRSEALDLAMAGDWFITVTVVGPDGTTQESSQPLQVGR